METSLASSVRLATVKAAQHLSASLPADWADRLARLASDTAEYPAAARLPVLPRGLNFAGTLLRTAATNKRMAPIERLVQERKFEQAARLYRELIGRQPTVSIVYEVGMRLARSRELGDAFTRAAVDEIRTPELRAMITSLLQSPAIYHPSRFWLYFMVYNAFQIETAGIDSFKQTVNHNYFNWTSDYDIQLQSQSLQASLGLSDQAVAALERDLDAPLAQKPAEFSRSKWQLYARFLALLAELAVRSDGLKLLETCSEPELGRPLYVRYRGRAITQDLCNSIIDVNTIAAGLPGGLAERPHIAEIGAGHGRIENILLRARPDARVTIIDIPPALYVSQWYLSRLFPDKKVFTFRDFKDFASVREEFEGAGLAFLTPAQAELLPPKIFDGFVNICSLQEMRPEQVANWFKQIDRLCRGWFFSKQYKVNHNPIDDVAIRREDYPVPTHWRPLFDRDNPGNTSMFEALYTIGA